MSILSTPEKYRQHPIYGTDFNLRLSQLVEGVKNELLAARGHLTDIQYGYPNWKDRVSHVDGLLTCGVMALHLAKEEIVKFEIEKDDKERGRSLQFRPRGIGTDVCPCCFACQAAPGADDKPFMSNIAAFVGSKADGEEIVKWFKGAAWLDFRPSEPSWIQVKVGACVKHFPNLERLFKSSSTYGLLREADIIEAIAATPQ
jgi:hypothetical protein